MVGVEAVPPGLRQLPRGLRWRPLNNLPVAHLRALQHTHQSAHSKLARQLSRAEALACSVRWLLLLRKFVRQCIASWLLPTKVPRCALSFSTTLTSISGVAVGSSIGHAIGGMFGGGSSQAAEQQSADNAVARQANNDSYQNDAWGPRSCEADAKQFTKCLDDNQGNMQICSWYLDQLVSSTPLPIV